MERVAIVTGGSGGIGRCTAQSLYKAGAGYMSFREGKIPDRG